MPPRRRLLYLARDFPIPVSSAARLRTYNWVMHLSKHFDITFVAPVGEPPEATHVEGLEPYCTRLYFPRLQPHAWGPRAVAGRALAELRFLVSGRPPEAWWLQRAAPGAVIEELRGEQRFDVVFMERWTWGAAALASGSRIVLDAAALQAGRVEAMLRVSRNPLRRLLRRHIARGMARLEERAVSRATLVLTLDPAARESMRQVCGDNRTLLLPSGLSTQYFAPRRTLVDPSNVLFFGALANPAQRDALVHLHHDIMPLVRQRLRHAHLTVVGEASIPEIEPGDLQDVVSFTGMLEDERQVLWRGAVAALPLRFGSGPRMRIAQLLAMGIPLVTTRAGVRGLDLRSGDGVLVVPDGPEFAAALAEALLDSSLRDDLSRRGRQVAQTRLSLSATFDRVSALLAQDVLSL